MCKVSQFIHKMNNLGLVACMVYHEKQSVFPGGISAITWLKIRFMWKMNWQYGNFFNGSKIDRTRHNIQKTGSKLFIWFHIIWLHFEFCKQGAKVKVPTKNNMVKRYDMNDILDYVLNDDTLFGIILISNKLYMPNLLKYNFCANLWCSKSVKNMDF